MTSRQRSSSARSNKSDINQRQISTPSPSHYPQNGGTSVPEDLILSDVPTYGNGNAQSSLLVPSQGSGSPYPAISGCGATYTQGLLAASHRPRANTADQTSTQQGGYRIGTRPSGGPQVHINYHQRQQAATAMETGTRYIPGPPPPTISASHQQNHMMSLPPPPPRPPAMNSSHGIVVPPPPGPPPGSSQSLPWVGQPNWVARSQNYLPPPPPMIQAQANNHTSPYNLNNSYSNHHPAALAIPPPPPQAEPLVLTSATYIPYGDSFGPGVGIPALHPQQPNHSRGDGSDYYGGGDIATIAADQRYFDISASAISPSKELPAPHSYYPQPVPQTPLQRPYHQPLVSNRELMDYNSLVSTGNIHHTSAQTPISSVTAPEAHSVHRYKNIGPSSGLLSPSDPSLQWSIDRVLSWLAKHGFSNDWQEAFRNLDIQGMDFLELGRANGGRGNFGMMHQLVYPQLSRECVKSGSGWDQVREREEGKRMRRLIRKLADDSWRGIHSRNDSNHALPSASTDGGLESSPNLGRPEAFANTPNTAGGGEESPGRSGFKPAGAPFTPRTSARSNITPVPSTSGMESSGAEAGHTVQRTNLTRTILNGINEAGSKRHSPSASSDNGSGFLGDGMRSGNDASPQSGSPATIYATPAFPSVNGNLSAHAHGRLSHRPSNSTESVVSNTAPNAMLGPGAKPSASAKRNGLEGHRPTALEVGGRQGSYDGPLSAKEHNKTFLDRIWKRKESAQPSPEDRSLESPTSPLYSRHPPPSLPFARPGMSHSGTSVDRTSSTSTMNEHDGLVSRGNLAQSNLGKKYVFVTPDNWNYRLVDISNADDADQIRQAISIAMGGDGRDLFQLYITEAGQLDHDEHLTDSLLPWTRINKADASGSLKLFMRRIPNSAGLQTPLSAGLGIGMSQRPLQSPPFGSLSPRKPVNTEPNLPVKLNGRHRSKSPPSSRNGHARHPSTSYFDDNSQSSPTDTPEDTIAERVNAIKAAHQNGTLSEDDLAWLAAGEKYRRESEKKENALQPGKQGRPQKASRVDSSSWNGKRDGVIGIDPRGVSPYEEKNSEILIPMRKPPPAPAESSTLIKANSLTRKTGERAKANDSRPASDTAKRRSGVDTIAEEAPERGRREAVAPTPSVSAGIGESMAEARKAAESAEGAEKSNQTPKKPVGHKLGSSDLSDAPQRALKSIDFGSTGSGRNSPGGSPRSPGFTYGKNNMLFKIPDYEEVPPAESDSLIPQQIRMLNNPSIEELRRHPSPAISPGSEVPPQRRPSLLSIRRSYGPAYNFKESEVTFEQRSWIHSQSDDDSDDDSDDGLFAVPIKGTIAKPSSKLGSDDEPQRRPTLTVKTDTHTRRSKGLSVAFKTPETSTSTSTNHSCDTVELDDEGHPIGSRPESSTPGASSAQSDEAMAKLMRRQSFARDDVWANRPAAEDLLENLDDFFPHLDLDQPVVEDLVGSPPLSPNSSTGQNPMDNAIPGQPYGRRHIRSSLYDRPRPTSIAEESIAEEPDTLGSEDSTLKSRITMQSIAQRSMHKSGGLGRMKSIRDVARGAYQGSSKRYTQPSTNTKSSNIQRRKSTKMFGANIVQIKPGRGSRVSLIESVPKDLPPGQNSFQIGRGQLIGKGSYGRVYLGINLTTGDFLAVKQVEVNQKAAGQDKDKMKEMVAALDQEIDTMQHLEHPNIVQYLGCERKEYSISIFLEYISGGSIGSCYRKHGKFEENLVSSLTKQTLEGLAYLHHEGVLHRDLKADNILLDIDGTCKISDFGISKKTDNIYGTDKSNNMQGSVFWMAPEVVQGQGYSAKVDIWSLGCVVLEMFQGKRPWFKEEGIGAIYKLGNNMAPPIPDDVSSSISAGALGFMFDCFTIDPSERPIAERLKSHQFCRNADNDFNFLDTELHNKIREVKESVQKSGSY